MEIKEFVDTLLSFKPGGSLSDVRAKLDGLVSFCREENEVEMEAYIITTGDESTLQLMRIGKLISESVNYMYKDHRRISDAYELDRLRPWLTEYSKDHLDDDVLYVRHFIKNEDGTEAYPYVTPTDEYLKRFNCVAKMPIDNCSEGVTALEEETDNYEENEENLVGETDDFQYDSEYWPYTLSEVERLDMGIDIGLPIINPLKEKKADEHVIAALKVIKSFTQHMCETIDCYVVESGGNNMSVVGIAKAIAPIIDGIVFNEPIDGAILEDVFRMKDKHNLTIQDERPKFWVQILWLMYKDGPKECRNKEWINRIASDWNMKHSLVNRIYEPLGYPTADVMKQIREVVKKMNGVNELNVDKKRPKRNKRNN